MRRQLDAERAARRELQRVMAAVQSDAVAAPDLSFLNNLREVPVREPPLSCVACQRHASAQSRTETTLRRTAPSPSLGRLA